MNALSWTEQIKIEKKKFINSNKNENTKQFWPFPIIIFYRKYKLFSYFIFFFEKFMF